MWRGYVPRLVPRGVQSCWEWTRRGYADAVLPQLLVWSADEVPIDPDLPPWFGVEALHLSPRSALRCYARTRRGCLAKSPLGRATVERRDIESSDDVG